MNTTFEDKVKRLFAQHEELITRKNEPVETTNGVYTRYKYPVVTAAHTPVFWRYDLDEKDKSLSDGTHWNECCNEFRSY